MIIPDAMLISQNNGGMNFQWEISFFFLSLTQILLNLMQIPH